MVEVNSVSSGIMLENFSCGLVLEKTWRDISSSFSGAPSQIGPRNLCFENAQWARADKIGDIIDQSADVMILLIRMIQSKSIRGRWQKLGDSEAQAGIGDGFGTGWL